MNNARFWTLTKPAYQATLSIILIKEDSMQQNNKF